MVNDAGSVTMEARHRPKSKHKGKVDNIVVDIEAHAANLKLVQQFEDLREFWFTQHLPHCWLKATINLEHRESGADFDPHRAQAVCSTRSASLGGASICCRRCVSPNGDSAHVCTMCHIWLCGEGQFGQAQHECGIGGRGRKCREARTCLC